MGRGGGGGVTTSNLDDDRCSNLSDLTLIEASKPTTLVLLLTPIAVLLAVLLMNHQN